MNTDIKHITISPIEMKSIGRYVDSGLFLLALNQNVIMQMNISIKANSVRDVNINKENLNMITHLCIYN